MASAIPLLTAPKAASGLVTTMFGAGTGSRLAIESVAGRRTEIGGRGPAVGPGGS